MPLHIFLAQSLSLITGGLEVWKAAKDVLVMAVALLSIYLVWRTRAYKNTSYILYLRLALLYLFIHVLVYAFTQNTSPAVASLATVYNNRLLWFLGVGLGAGLVLKNKLRTNSVLKVVLGISTVVSLLGVLQYFLPKDILTHVGYSLERGVMPAFFIDAKPDLPRIMSTLRDPNSLGAYLLVPNTVLFYYWLTRPARRQLLSGLLFLHGLALFLTFSRSAWLATSVSGLIVLAGLYGRTVWSFTKRFGVILAVGVVLAGAGLYGLRDQYVVQNIIVHSDESTTQTDSNNLHVQLAKQGIEGIVDQPLGHGPGTAGLVSIQTDKVVLTENYYIQIGYEVGLIGLGLLLFVHALIYGKIRGRKDALGLTLFATFWGYVLINTLLHTWSNEAVAAQWWLLAGLSLVAVRNSHNKLSRN